MFVIDEEPGAMEQDRPAQASAKLLQNVHRPGQSVRLADRIIGTRSGVAVVDGASATSNYFGNARGGEKVPYIFGENAIEEFQVVGRLPVLRHGDVRERVFVEVERKDDRNSVLFAQLVIRACVTEDSERVVGNSAITAIGKSFSWLGNDPPSRQEWPHF